MNRTTAYIPAHSHIKCHYADRNSETFIPGSGLWIILRTIKITAAYRLNTFDNNRNNRNIYLIDTTTINHLQDLENH